MRLITFTKRTAQEILIDPLSVFFGLGFPVVLLLLLTAINKNVPAGMGPDNFELTKLTPGISVFGMSFVTLFSALLVSKDRSSSLLQRLFTTPLTAIDYIIGYTLPMIPISLMQGIVCYAIALMLGLQFTVNIVWSLLCSLVTSLLFTAMGLLFGSMLTDKQVGGICGALITNLTAWLSGIWFDIDLVGDVFVRIANALPFVHAVEMQRAALAGDFSGVLQHIWWVAGYAIVLSAAAVLVFTSKMKEK